MQPEELIATTYHENSKIRRFDRRYGLKIRFINENPLIQQNFLHCFKRYRGAPTVALPSRQEWQTSDGELEALLRARRSIRRFTGSPLELWQVSKLLFLGDGLTGELHDRNGKLIRHLRTSPSAGGLFPIELYLASLNVAGLEQGIYHYSPKDHRLELLRAGSHSSLLDDCCGQAGEVIGAAAVFFLTAVFQRTLFKYEERGYRFILLEAGHIGQNLLLAAGAMGLGSVAIGGFLDEQVERVLDVDGFNEAPVYMVAIGALEPPTMASK